MRTILLLTLLATAAPLHAVELTTGRDLYLAACASCHGADGSGVSKTVVGFDEPIPDFTDCNFATREPDPDWVAIAHDGGPVRGFAPMMPAFGEALNEEELARIIAHIRTFCGREWPRGILNLPRALVTEKAFPEDEAVLTSSASAEGNGAFTNKFIYESRFGARNQWELIVPFAFEERGPDAGSSWKGGLGDVALGVKRVLAHSAERGFIFSAAAELVLPTGDDSEGFGNGTPVLEPFVAYGRILPKDSFLQFQGGAEFPFDEDRAEREGFARFVLGRSFVEGRFGRTWSPMVELLAKRELASGAETDWDVVPQVQFTLNTRQHVMASVGVRLPVNDSGARNTEVLFYLLWDWFDGGFHEGW